MTNLFKKLVFTDKAIDDLTVAVQAGKSITVERAVLSGWTPPDDDQVYTPYKNSSGALDVAAVKANINKYFDKTEALKNTAPAWVEGILKPKTVEKENKNTLNFALDFENTDFDHDVAAKYYGYTSWAELLDDMSEFNIDAQSVALLAQDDTGLEYVFAFAKIESDDSLKYPAALTTELTHKLHIDLFINITQSDNIIIKYTPDGLVEYNEFAQHVANAEDVYAKKINVYTKVESDNSFLTKSDAAATYTTKTENAKKANSSDVYDKTTADGRFVRGAKVNDGPTVTPNSDGTLELNVPAPDLSNYYNKGEVDEKVNNAGKVKTVNNVSPDTSGNVTVDVGVKKVNNTAPDANGNVATIQIFDSNAAARDYSAQHPNVLTGVLL